VSFIFLHAPGLVRENGNESAHDEFAFTLGIGDAIHWARKAVGGVHADYAQTEAVARNFQSVSHSFLRSKAVLTKMLVMRSPMARCTMTGGYVESDVRR